MVDVGGGICAEDKRVGAEAGVGSGMAMTLLRFVFASNSLSPSCRVSLEIFFSSFAFTLNASRVRSSASSTSWVLRVREASSSTRQYWVNLMWEVLTCNTILQVLVVLSACLGQGTCQCRSQFGAFPIQSARFGRLLCQRLLQFHNLGLVGLDLVGAVS
jgi:hypothetical protein